MANEPNEPKTSSYKYLDWVVRVVTAANARIPRLHPSAISGLISDMASQAVTRGDIVQSGDQLLTVDGRTEENFIEDIVAERTKDGFCYLEIQPEVVEVQSDVWTSGSLTKQGERYRELRAVFGKGPTGDKLAQAAFEAEAKVYRTVPGSTKPGIAPGAKPSDDVDNKSVGPRLAVSTQPSDNPWDVPAWHGTEQARLDRIQSIIRTSSSLAVSMATKANVTLSGKPRQKVKGY